MFRVWDYITNKYYYSWDVLFGKYGEVLEICLQGIPVSESEPLANFRSLEEVVIEQFTGLWDKNGQKIYVGDIIDYNDDGDCIGYVVYNAPSFEIMENIGYSCWLKGGPHQRVIGNIHENPDLVKKSES